MQLIINVTVEASYDHIYQCMSRDNSFLGPSMEMTAMQSHTNSRTAAVADYRYACAGPVSSYSYKKKKGPQTAATELAQLGVHELETNTSSVDSGYSRLSHSKHGQLRLS